MATPDRACADARPQQWLVLERIQHSSAWLDRRLSTDKRALFTEKFYANCIQIISRIALYTDDGFIRWLEVRGESFKSNESPGSNTAFSWIPPPRVLYPAPHECMFSVSTLLLDDELKPATPLINCAISGVAGLSASSSSKVDTLNI